MTCTHTNTHAQGKRTSVCSQEPWDKVDKLRRTYTYTHVHTRTHHALILPFRLICTDVDVATERRSFPSLGRTRYDVRQIQRSLLMGAVLR